MKSREQAAEEYQNRMWQLAPFWTTTDTKTDFLAGWDAKVKQNEERIKSLEDKLKLAEWALLVYANKEHLFGPFAESEPGYIRGKQVTVCRHIGQTAMEALTKIRGEVK